MINIVRQIFLSNGDSILVDKGVKEYTFDEIYKLYIEDLAYREVCIRVLNRIYKKTFEKEAGNTLNDDLTDRYMESRKVRDKLHNKTKIICENRAKRNKLSKISNYNREDNINCYLDENDTISKYSRNKRFICRKLAYNNIEYVTYKNKHYLTKDIRSCSVSAHGLRTDIYRHKGTVGNNKFIVIIEDKDAGFDFYSWFIVEYLNRKSADSGCIEIHMKSANGKNNIANIIATMGSKYTGCIVIGDSIASIGKSITLSGISSGMKNVMCSRKAIFAPLSFDLLLSTFGPMVISSCRVKGFNPEYFNEIIDRVNTNKPVITTILGSADFKLLEGKYSNDLVRFRNNNKIKNYGYSLEAEIAILLAGNTYNTCYKCTKEHMKYPWVNNCCEMWASENLRRNKCSSSEFVNIDKIELWSELKFIKELIKLVKYVILGVECESIVSRNVEEWVNK